MKRPNIMPPLLPLPQMETYEQAVAVSKSVGDHFFVCAFMLKGWICNLMSDTLLSYHTPDHRPDDLLQDGRAWDGFCELFPELPDKQFHHALNALFRYTQYDDRFAATLLRAQTPLALEQQLSGRPFVPQPHHSPRLLRRTAEFWCDWLEAAIHLEIHRAVRTVKQGLPHDGPDDRAAFGFPMCRFPSAQASASPASASHHVVAPGKTTRDSLALDEPPYPGEEIETMLIALQPLAKRYRWTATDFFEVLTALVRHPAPGLCWAHCDLGIYRDLELGLPPLEDDNDQLPGPPAGLALAHKICPPDTQDSPPSSSAYQI